MGVMGSRQIPIQSAEGSSDGPRIVKLIRDAATELGFSQIGICGVDLSTAEPGLRAWLEAGFHGHMHYMAAHGMKRARPAELVPGTVSVISVSLPYLPLDAPEDWLAQEGLRMHAPGEAVISMYARGRDYHKVVRARLQQLGQKVQDFLGPMGHRAFCDSAPVLEVEMAQRSGLGWRGKHTLALHREAGSLFFLGELFVDVELPQSEPVSAHCGSCTACLEACPTRAIVAPYRLDARRCISYLTIEHDGVIDPELRPLMGNRIYGCDDCQWVCPWNKYAQRSTLPDFLPRAGLQGAGLRTLWAWDEAEFLRRTQGTAIRRIGWVRWRRNLAIGLGNALTQCEDASEARRVRQVLQDAQSGSDPVVQIHIDWALSQGRGEGQMP